MRVICAWCQREGRSGFLREREPLDDPGETHGICLRHQQLVAQMYERGHAINAAAALEIDAVIDPAATRQWLVSGLDAGAANPERPVRSYVDAW